MVRCPSDGRAVDEDGVVAVDQPEQGLAQAGSGRGSMACSQRPSSGAGRQEVDPVAPASSAAPPGPPHAVPPPVEDVGHRGSGPSPDRSPSTQVLLACGSRSTTSTRRPSRHGRRGQSQRHRGLPDAALLVDHGHDRTHAGHAATLGRAAAGRAADPPGCTLQRGRLALNVTPLAPAQHATEPCREEGSSSPLRRSAKAEAVGSGCLRVRSADRGPSRDGGGRRVRRAWRRSTTSPSTTTKTTTCSAAPGAQRPDPPSP